MKVLELKNRDRIFLDDEDAENLIKVLVETAPIFIYLKKQDRLINTSFIAQIEVDEEVESTPTPDDGAGADYSCEPRTSENIAKVKGMIAGLFKKIA